VTDVRFELRLAPESLLLDRDLAHKALRRRRSMLDDARRELVLRFADYVARNATAFACKRSERKLRGMIDNIRGQAVSGTPDRN